jgi:putative ABC transport system permease protein
MTRTGVLAGVGLALSTVREHKMRSFLTVLGVIIGTGTIIGVGSIIAGLDGAITGVLSSMGSDAAIIFKFQPGFRGRLTPEEIQRKPLTYEDAQAIATRCQSVASAAAYLFPHGIDQPGFTDNARYKGNEMYSVDIGGTQEGYAASGYSEMKEGRFFTDNESIHRVPVAVVGEDVPTALMTGGENPIGKWIKVDGQQVQIVGVMKRPAASFPGQNDARILIPYFSMKKLFPQAKENMIIIKGKNGNLAAAIDEARAVLRVQRHVPFDKPDNFNISTSQQMIEQFHSVTGMIALVMVVLSSIGLLVGGIGVMNIMLVSVTERTREIGVRKAIGARRSDIVLQFLTEAVVLTGLGGLLGMTVGYGLSLIARAVFPSLPTAVPLWAAILGVFVSVGVGLFFGIWPANKAARLDPVVALRYE